MSVTSPLASLYTVLQAVRSNAELNALLLRKNEAATRAALIDPVLRALGWDTTNVQMVEPERTVEGKQTLDYVLKDVEGRVSSIIEAKKLDESLDKLGHVGAVIGYAFSLKPQRFFITDGIHWHYYSPAHSSYHPVATIDFFETPLIECALQLIHWLDAAQSGYGITPTSLLPLEALPTLSPVATASVAPAVAAASSPFTDLAQVHPSPSGPNEKPKKLRLPDGSVVAIKTWKDILVKTCLYVLGQQPKASIPYPDKAGKKKFLLDWQKPAAGIGYVETTLQGRPLFIYTNYSAPDCVSNARHVLKLLSGKATVAVAF